MKYKIYNSKKGIAIDELIPAIIVIFVIAILGSLLYFGEVQENRKDIADIKKQQDFSYANQILVGYLSKLDDTYNTKADALSSAYNKKSYESVKKDMQNYLDVKLSGLSWELEIFDSLKNKVFSLESPNEYPPDSEEVQVGLVTIPINGLEPNYMQISLYFRRKYTI